MLVRREDATIQEIEIMEEYCSIVDLQKKYFPKYEQKFLQFPEVFTTKLKTEGFPEKKEEFRACSLPMVYPCSWGNGRICTV